MLGCGRPTLSCLAKSVAAMTGDVSPGNERGTMGQRCRVHLYRGLCMADRRATIAPWPRGARRVSPDDHYPEMPRTAWHGGAGR